MESFKPRIEGAHVKSTAFAGTGDQAAVMVSGEISGSGGHSAKFFDSASRAASLEVSDGLPPARNNDPNLVDMSAGIGFIAKADMSGHWEWVRRIPASRTDAMLSASGNSYFTDDVYGEAGELKLQAVHAVDPKGNETWTKPMGADPNLGVSADSEGNLLVLSDEGTSWIGSYDKSNGQQRWRRPLPGEASDVGLGGVGAPHADPVTGGRLAMLVGKSGALATLAVSAAHGADLTVGSAIQIGGDVVGSNAFSEAGNALFLVASPNTFPDAKDLDQPREAVPGYPAPASPASYGSTRKDRSRAHLASASLSVGQHLRVPTGHGVMQPRGLFTVDTLTGEIVQKVDPPSGFTFTHVGRTIGAKSPTVAWASATGDASKSLVFLVGSDGGATPIIAEPSYSPNLAALPEGGFVASTESGPAGGSGVGQLSPTDVRFTVIPGA